MVVAEGWAKVLVFHFHLKFNFCTYCSLQLLISFLGTMDICYVDFLDKWTWFVQVREQGQQKGEASPFLAEFLRLEEQAKQQGLGRWSKASPQFHCFNLSNWIFYPFIYFYKICSEDYLFTGCEIGVFQKKIHKTFMNINYFTWTQTKWHGTEAWLWQPCQHLGRGFNLNPHSWLLVLVGLLKIGIHGEVPLGDGQNIFLTQADIAWSSKMKNKSFLNWSTLFLFLCIPNFL